MTTISPTNVKTEPYKFTANEKQRLTEAHTEIERLDAALVEACNIRPALQEAASDFAAGLISIREAIGLLAAGNDSSKRAEIEATLRRPLKARIRATVASVSDLIEKARQHHVSELAAKASGLEKSERSQAGEFGVASDDFQPSDLLQGIREQHKRAMVPSPVTRTELAALV
jgi:hypothetical protein